jgi:biopolymer transport protein ExbB
MIIFNKTYVYTFEILNKRLFLPRIKIEKSNNMKKFITIFTMIILMFAVAVNIQAQEEEVTSQPTTEQLSEASTDVEVIEEAQPKGLTQMLKQRFIEGGALWMSPVLLCLIIGLAVCIERILSLSLAEANTAKLLSGIDGALKSGNTEKAKEICKATRGPVASVLYQGLDRVHEGIDIVEKSIVSYGSVQMGKLERGITWISLFIAIAPMLGFLGTVVGMVQAFDYIVQYGEVDPVGMAGGIKVALLTTIFGLIVAIILQIFYNYIISKVDGLVNKMEDASISLVDMIVKYNVK